MSKRCNNVLGGRTSVPYRPNDSVQCDLCHEKMRHDSIKKHFKRKHGSNESLAFHRVGEEPAAKQQKIGSFLTQPGAGMLTSKY